MKIRSIEIINLRSYEHTVIELSRNINLLIGANNSGKSTIIKSLLNLQYNVFNEKDVRAGERYAKIFTKVAETDEKDSYRFYDPAQPNDHEIASNYEIRWHLHGQKEDYLYVSSSYKIERLELDKIKVTDVNGGDVPLKKFPRLPDSEDKDNFIYPFLSKRKTEYYDTTISQEQSFKVEEGLRNLAAKIKKIENPSHPRNREFNSLCDDILGFRIGTLAIGESHMGMEAGIYVGHTAMIPLKAMGDGVATIVGFIVTLLTEDKKLYLVEELENDIHPKALKKLLTLIEKKAMNNQFLISTHSHIVLKYLGIIPETKIFYTESTTVRDIPTSTVKEIENRPESRIDVLEKLGYDFHDFELYEAYLILEESTAERIIRDFLIPFFVPSLYSKLETIAAKGVDDLKPRVIDFYRLFVFIHTSPIYKGKAWVVADGDKAGKECIQDLKNTFKDWPEEHFLNFSSDNFEGYYPERFKKQVDAALKLKGQEKRQAKKALVNEVIEWALMNREQAVKEFEICAAEVIFLLRSIESRLMKSS